ncbi:MAG: trypsin-like serine protease [Clostridium sp.]|uniref:trypsin-like serine protease n=1 Tax=Clostridium sp. TaxID=1506 RepID=UPI003F40361E
MNSVHTDISSLCRTDFNFFLDFKNVNGVGFGYKETNGLLTDIPCFKVLVEKKEDLSNLEKDDILPDTYKGFATDIIEVGIITPYAFTTKIRPVEGGTSTSVTNQFIVGTLGCRTHGFVGTADEVYALSNNHVFSLENSVLFNKTIMQPGQGDGGSPSTDVIGTFFKYIPLKFNGQNNYVDCALTKISDPSSITDKIHTIGSIANIAPPKLGLQIQKFGRTTSYTTGTITALNATVNVNYTNGTARFVGQIVASPMSNAGDSGSLILDMKNRAVGLLFAGSGSATIINDITSVLTLLGIRLP